MAVPRGFDQAQYRGPSHRPSGKVGLSEIRLLLANTSRMLQSLITAILVQEPDIVVAGSVAEHEDLTMAIDAARADVVIVSGQTPEAASSYDDTLRNHPHIRLLMITAVGDDGYLYALRPTLTPIPDLSVATLLAAIRAGWGSGEVGPVATQR
jgi:DNA-binding NarL/FixJ family response regulator